MLFLLFTVSGFAGLIYESIWSHYLKLFLGHAAYAQTLVLALFMGGMAVGAWLVSRFSARLANSLRGYALVEAVIGIAAIVFHPVFVATTDAAYDSLLPALGSDTGAAIVKWLLAAALILPQSVLLGATFPLMSGGLLRRHPERPGESLAMLYFTNSLGAAVGVLASGFVLIERLGLPGTIQAAGVLNLVLAAIVWFIAPGQRSRPGARRFGDARAESRGAQRRRALAPAARGGRADRDGVVHLRDRLDPDAHARARRRDALVRAHAVGLHPRARLRRLLGARPHRPRAQSARLPRRRADRDGAVPRRRRCRSTARRSS